MYTVVFLVAGVALVAGVPQGGQFTPEQVDGNNPFPQEPLGVEGEFSLGGQTGTFPQEDLGAGDDFSLSGSDRRTPGGQQAGSQRPHNAQRVGSQRPQGGQRQSPQRPIGGQHDSQGFICVKDGVYEDPKQCDKYWVCEGGVARSLFCDDGLVFDIFKANVGSADPCESPYVVDCGERLLLQEATYPSKYCPRANGIYADPDPQVCFRFFTCIQGLSTPTDCITGLHFDETTGLCNWPDSVGRTDCVADKANTCTNNGAFCCTGEQVINNQGVLLPHPTFMDAEDCQKFYVCLNGQTPQESSCSLGQVYNDKTMMCDFPENVPDCVGWYENNPLFDVAYDDADGDGIRDFGDRRDFAQTSVN
ncbi:protein obstructor-E-like isoform X2 [Homarus americanus]|uniref:protein obstructor-E-like isoform X2 n=1 Tax=Homarus americanus TaxID=6706 RepID=UPI001C43CF38|nr:protein obstructor-E-like isoform X2 [Homarus americanus]